MQRKFSDVSYEVPGTTQSGFGPIRRALVSQLPPSGLPVHNDSGMFCLTSYENFVHASEIFRDRPYLGHRPLKKDGTALGYKWSSYGEARKSAELFSSGVVEMNLCPKSNGDFEIREQGVLGIMMRNRPEWCIAEQACFLQRMVPVPFYDTAKSETLAAIIGKLSSLKTIVCSSLTINELVKTKRDHPAIGLEVLVCVDPVDIAVVSAAKQIGLRVISFKEVLDVGSKKGPIAHNPPCPDDIYTFCFTSGTTGEPKGALITHRNIISNATGLAERLVTWAVGKESVLSFLPLPHMFERVAQLLTVNVGGSIGFFQGDPLRLVEDLQALRPTRFVAVPRVLTRIQERVTMQIKEQGGVKAALFEGAIRRKLNIENDPVSMITDKLMFKKVGEKLGLDRVKQILTGSAPIAPSTLRWFRAVFPGVPVNEGYGQTECTLVCSLQGTSEVTAGDCGAPLSCCDVRLMDVPEMGYRSSDREHGRNNDERIPCVGRGEICIRGDNVFKGYYKMPDKTAEAIDEHGWLHTGDIGLWTSNGQLKIIDRKKNIFKLSQGEYVAPEKIESVFSTSKFVLQSFVYGDSVRNHLVAVIVPNPDSALDWALKQSGSKASKDLKTIVKSPEFKASVLADLQSKSRQAKLNGYEVVKNIHLEPDMWTNENLLTPTFKLKRKEAENKYRSEIERMYVEDETAVAARL
jgi:long-chain acyl-CoA synthetase